MRYLAFDVETPNSRNNRISAIGIAVVEDGAVREEFYSLVDPETHFDRFNVELTGITPEMAEGAPTFPELWEKVEPILETGLLVAHNAPFDMSVLAKCLHDHNIFWKRTVPYACTCQMGRRLLPHLENHRLSTLCGHFKIELDHHHAGSDSRACGEILLRYLRAGAKVSSFTRNYDLIHIRTCR